MDEDRWYVAAAKFVAGAFFVGVMLVYMAIGCLESNSANPNKAQAIQYWHDLSDFEKSDICEAYNTRNHENIETDLRLALTQMNSEATVVQVRSMASAMMDVLAKEC